MRQGRVESPAYLAGPAAAIFTLLLAVWIPVRIGSAASADLLPADELTPDPLAWLETVDSLITPSEATVYRTLQHDYRRQAFIDRFWSERDPFPETSRNEFLEAWLFNASPQLPEPITLVFLQESAAAGASLNHWSPTNGLDSLISRTCRVATRKALRQAVLGPPVQEWWRSLRCAGNCR